MKTTPVLIALCLSLLLPTSALRAETRYVSDQLVVTLRSGTGDNYQAVENLKTDSPVRVLQDTGAFVQVTTEKGNTGYIQSHYVSKEIPKPIRIAELKQQIIKLQAELEKCSKTAASANEKQATIDDISKKLQQAQAELAKVSSDYENLLERSQDVVTLTTAYEQQSEENSRLSSELEVLQVENNNFHRSNMIQWFLAGGAVFFCGWLVGKISRRKRGFKQF